MDLTPKDIARLKASIVAAEPPTSLREVLAHDFPETCSNLPITGGWGRVKERAVVLEPRALETAKVELDQLEHLIAKHIVYEELIVFRRFDDRFNGIIVEPTWRKRVRDARALDHTAVRVTCWPEQQWKHLENEAREHLHGRAPAFDTAAFVAKREAWRVVYEREFWFDVTDVAN